MSKHLIVALVAAAGLAGCGSGDKDRGRTTSATTTRTSDTDRPTYQTATARDMQQGWVPGRPPSATTSQNLARAEAQTGVSARTSSVQTVGDTSGGATVRPAGYTGGQQQARIMTTAAAAPASAAPIAGDAFVRESLAGDIFEVESSRLALERASDERLRQFAQMMVDDHSQAHDRLMQAADVQGIEVSGRPTPRQIAMLERLAGLEGTAFDLEYSQAQVDAHQQAVTLHERFLQTGRNPQLQAQAEERLPIIRGHLEEIRPLAEELYFTTLHQNGLGAGQDSMRRPMDRQRPMDQDRPRDQMRPADQNRPMDEGLQPDRRTTPRRNDSGALPPPMRRDTPGMTPGQQPDRAAPPTGPDQPRSQPANEPDPR